MAAGGAEGQVNLRRSFCSFRIAISVIPVLGANLLLCKCETIPPASQIRKLLRFNVLKLNKVERRIVGKWFGGMFIFNRV